MERSRTDLYRVLQVDPSANPLVIQAAYRALAQIFHPDLAGDADEMKRINAAWEVLGDPRRRRQYDIELARQHRGATAPHAAPSHGSNDAPVQAPTSPWHANQHANQHAGPPPGRPFGPVLRFGRYDGWSLGEVLRVDRAFLEWLREAPHGRGLRDAIDAVLATKKGPGAVDERRHYETNQRHAHAGSAGAPAKSR